MIERHKAGFIYTLEHIGADGKLIDTIDVRNLIPTVGLNYLLEAALRGGSQYSSWYLGLYSTAYTPVAGDTLATFIAACGENTAYTGTARQAVTLPAISGGATSTVSSPNTFAFTSSETITGAFIASSSVWESTTGLLISAVEFPSAKSLATGETLRVPVGFGLTSA